MTEEIPEEMTEVVCEQLGEALVNENESSVEATIVEAVETPGIDYQEPVEAKSLEKPAEQVHEIWVNTLVTLENSVNKALSSKDIKSVEEIIFSANHMRENIWNFKANQLSSCQFRNGRFKHIFRCVVSLVPGVSLTD